MMVPLSSKVSSQIRFLLQSLGDSNSDLIFHELCECTSYGTEGSILLLQACLDHLNISGVDSKNMKTHPIYASLFRYLLDRPNFSTVFCESLRTIGVTEEILQNLSSSLHLSVPEKIRIGLALSGSQNIDLAKCGKNFCVGQIVELCANPIPLESTELIQQIIMFVSRSEGCSELLDSFMRMLSLFQLKHGAELITSPFLPNKSREEIYFRHASSFNDDVNDDFDAILAEMEKEMSMADVMNELGCGCTINETQCKQVLSLYLPLTDTTISKILGTVVRTYAGLEHNQNVFTTFRSALDGNNVPDQPLTNSWNVNVLVDSIKQLAPEVYWEKVIENLDHEGFIIPDERAFSLLMSIYKYACQDPFPLRAVCGFIWRNVEGQLSFLKYAVSSSPEVFTFSHSERQLANSDAMAGVSFQHGLENQAWSCLDLLEVLCNLAERGHANFVRSLLENPLQQRPEVLLLGLAHVNTTYNLIQCEVASALLPMVLRSATCNNIVLKLLHVNASMLLRGLIDVLNLEADNIYSIVDVCQDIKILPQVLDLIPYHYGIRLAALSSKKQFIDLETWMTNNLSMDRDVFYEECLKFLKEVQIAAQDVSANRFHPPASLLHIYLEACPVVVQVLQSHSGMLSSSHLSEEMEKLNVNYMRANAKAKNNGGTDSSSDSYADDVEAEANLYFHQLFSGQLDLDSMIQKLARFKESSDKREQSVFECMIANLFEEYKFFSKYPDRQLKIAAVLFGSLIKNQLVTHLTLGIALRGVLDALRKPADSKMFGFGIKALEQFVDRLIEWPQYCNHILQISHLRAAHPELVAFIERALNRISATHAEADAVHNATSDHNNPIQTSVSTSEIPASTFSQVGSGSLHVGTQVPSTTQLPQRPVGSMDERKVTAPQSSIMKAAHPPAQPPAVPTSDAAVNKAHSGVGVPSVHAPSPGIPRSSRASSTRFGSAINIETLVAAAERRETPIEAPPLEIQDKISFIINNLATTNMEAKAKEFVEIMNEQYYPWFAQYIVMKRTSIETNFHDLYLKFLDKVNLKPLNREIVKATYENCKVLLGSDLIKSTAEERSLLKNLGSWLGKITIGKNQVLRAREIDPKSLIIEAYEKGLMIAVIPFCSKVLESCSSSLAYQPPNPWTIGILGLLAEIYAMPNLKMNLKFEIEVLFKNLGVDLKDVAPTSLLKDRVREVEGNPDFSNKDAGSSQAQVVNDVKPGIIPTLNQVEIPLDITGPAHPGGHSRMMSQYAPHLHHSSGALVDDDKLVGLGFSDQLPSAHGLLQGQRQSQFSVSQLPLPASNIEQQVVVNKKLQSLNLHIHFQSVLPMIMDRSVKEIVTSIVQRSVSIAIQTTKELVLKDYAMETDETLIRNAAHLMVARLAGSLAHVTCKEPLRGSISSQLRGTLGNANLSNEVIEGAVQLATNDNLDLGCVLIEQAATDKALQSIDGEIAQQLAIRRNNRETVGSTFFDTSLYAQGQIGVLPESLRPRPGHLSHSQQRVYEDFARFPGQNRSSQSSNAVPVGPSVSSGSGGLSRQIPSSSGQVNPIVYSSGLVNTSLGDAAQSLEIVADDMDATASQIPSVPLAASEDSPRSLDLDAVSSFPPASNSDLQIMESAAPVKESGIALQPSNTAIGSERTNITEPTLTTGDALDKYQIISEKLDNLLKNDAKEPDIQGVVTEVPAVIIRCISRDEAALAVAQKAFKGLYENALNNAHVSAHLAILAAIRDVSKLVVKELTSWVIYSEEDRKFNKDITIGLIRSELLNLAEYNVHMAKLLDAGRNKAATEFAISLIQTLVVHDSKVISELHNLVDALAKLAARPGSPELLQQLVEIAKNPAANAAVLSPGAVAMDDSMRSSRDKKSTGLPGASKEDSISSEVVDTDPTGFHDQVKALFAEWYQICDLPGTNDAACAHYVLRLQQRGFLKGDEISDRFFRRIMELSVSHCLSSEVMNSSQSQSFQGQSLSFLAIDIFAKLVFSVLKFCPVDQGSSKLALLPKVLAVTVKFIQKDAEDKRSSFNPRPFFRLFINWVLDLCSLEPLVDGSNFQVLTALANSFHALQPLKVPGFSFAWLELVSHRSFMPKLLTTNAQKGWPYFQRLMMDLFQFMEPFLRNAELAEPVHFLYKGTLRVLLVLLHDFPEFLCDYHFNFCDVIPPSCIQMRNIILSAFPRNMRLPDPSTPNLKIDLLVEISQPPRILSEVDAALKAKQIKNDVDDYLQTRQQGSTFLLELKQKLLLSPTEAARAGTRYNVPLINSLVLYVGMQAIQQLQSRSPGHSQSMTTMTAFLVSAALDIFQTLMTDLETEGRYLFLSAIANQLRYPNNHTHYFSFILLYLFAESNQEVIQEQITRVLLERLIVNRPHPWGLLITFIELIKNPRYNFWSRSFTRCAPEIEKLFESVSRSCGGPKPVEDSVVSGGIADSMHPL